MWRVSVSRVRRGVPARRILPILSIVALGLTAVTGLAPQTMSAEPGLGTAQKPRIVLARGPGTDQGGGFFNRLFGGGSARTRDSRPPRRGFRFFRPRAPEPLPYTDAPAFSGSYRTLCVRLCDGYYFPISFSATQSRFFADEAQCQASCSAPARLFVYPNPGGAIEQMHDLSGQAYSSLPNAFRYRKEYLSSCRCKPDPWSEAAQREYKAREFAADDTDELSQDTQVAEQTAEPTEVPDQLPHVAAYTPEAAEPKPERPRRRAMTGADWLANIE